MITLPPKKSFSNRSQQSQSECPFNNLICCSQTAKMFRLVGATKDSISEWMDIGINGVVLESVVVEGQRFTTLDSIDRFANELAAIRPDWPDCLKHEMAVSNQ